ncbi:MAG: hypothetical protein AAGI38_04035 [Bacteroidota bacterium]
MEAYLSQLLTDLCARHGQFPPEPNMRSLAPDPHFPEAMTDSLAYLYGPRYSMSDLFDLEVEVFPPLEKLTEAQATNLAQAILDLWRSINIEADLPDDLPLHIAYPVLLQRWKGEPLSVV